MIIDYLRYVAFSGRLQGFFADGIYNYVEPSVTTGQHLRFAPEYLESRFGWRAQEIICELYWSPHSRDLIFEKLKRDLGLVSTDNGLTLPQALIGGTPPTRFYKEKDFPHLEIIIDIDPGHWSERYSDRTSYEDIPIIYRRAGPAKASFKSGDRILDSHRPKAGYGTLCGIFCSERSQDFGLTCGHVVAAGSRVSTGPTHRFWKLPFWSKPNILGEARYHTMCGPAIGIGPVRTQLDAALIALERSTPASEDPKVVRQATVKPISTVLQEEPVRFRGATRAIRLLVYRLLPFENRLISSRMASCIP
jgi:hypothetical protein